MANPGDTPPTLLPHSEEDDPEVTTIFVDPQSIAPAGERRRVRSDEAGSSRPPSSPTLRFFSEETQDYEVYRGQECSCGAARSFPDTLVHRVEQERDYLEVENFRLTDIRDYYRSENETIRRAAAGARERVERLEAEDQIHRAEISGHLRTIDTLRDELEQTREQHIDVLEENADLRYQVRRLEARFERLRPFVPDLDALLDESDGDESEVPLDEHMEDDEMMQDGLGAAAAVEPVEPEMDVELEPAEPETDVAMDFSEQGLDDDEELSEHDDDDDEDYDADAERDDSSDSSDGGSGGTQEAEPGWLME